MFDSKRRIGQNGFMKNGLRDQQGQVALIVVLVLVVMGVIVLSVVSRSVSDLRLAGVEQSSSQALKAAEAGIEEALRNINIGGSFEGTVNEASFETEAQSEGADGQVTNVAIETGEVVEVNVTGSASPPTSLDIYWADRGESNESPTGAVEVIKYQQFSGSDYRTVHYAFDPDATRGASNNFDAATVNPGSFMGVSFGARANIPIVAEDVIVRVRMLYNRGKIGVSPLPVGSLLPDQTYRIVSTGSTTDGVVRKVEAVRTLPVLPVVFDAALYSGGQLTQTN
jgi:Tfp pilus assembly protein PilX